MTSEKAEMVGQTYGPLAGAAAIKGIERRLSSMQNKNRDFKNFDEVMDYYKDVKAGDTLFFQETFMGGKGHPIIVLDGDTQFYWPSGDGHKNGVKKPLAVPKGQSHQTMAALAKKDSLVGQQHIRQILSETGQNPDLAKHYWGEPLRGKFFEIRMAKPGSGLNPVEIGSLESRLKVTTTAKTKVKDPTRLSGFRWEDEFSPVAARRLSEVRRPKTIDANLLNEKADFLQDKGEKGNVRYSFFKRKFDWDAPCTTGHCLSGADELLRQSGVPRGKPAITPSAVAKGLDLVIPAKTMATGKINMLSPLLLGVGATAAYRGKKEDNTKRTALGLGVAAAGVGINAFDSVKTPLSSLGGMLTRGIGGTLMEAPAKIIDKFRSRGGRYIPREETKLFALKEWYTKHPKAASRLGAGILGVATAPLLYKGINALTKPENATKGKV